MISFFKKMKKSNYETLLSEFWSSLVKKQQLKKKDSKQLQLKYSKTEITNFCSQCKVIEILFELGDFQNYLEMKMSVPSCLTLVCPKLHVKL